MSLNLDNEFWKDGGGWFCMHVPLDRLLAWPCLCRDILRSPKRLQAFRASALQKRRLWWKKQGLQGLAALFQGWKAHKSTFLSQLQENYGHIWDPVDLICLDVLGVVLLLFVLFFFFFGGGVFVCFLFDRCEEVNNMPFLCKSGLKPFHPFWLQLPRPETMGYIFLDLRDSSHWKYRWVDGDKNLSQNTKKSIFTSERNPNNAS